MLILPPTSINIKKARRIIKNGGVIIYPTDTLYGLGADIFNLEAVKKVFAIKGRDFKKPISAMLAKLSDLKQIAALNKQQETIARALLPGPFTLILKKKRCVSNLLTAGSQRVGIRLPDSKICRILAKNLPITATSANLSGQRTTLSIKKLAKIFANKVDLILVGKNLSGKPSTVINLTTKVPRIMR